MPRNGSGFYTLPAGNPVVDATVIESTWANPTMSDIAVQLNGVITRDGILGPSAPIKFQDGLVGSPGITFPGATTTGIYRDTNFVGFTFAGVKRLVATAAGAEVNGTLSVSGAITFTTPLAIAQGGTGGITAAAARTNLGVNVVDTASKSADYTLTLTDVGIYHPASDANTRTFTIDGSLAYPVGTALTFVNMSGPSCSIAMGTDTMYMAGLGTTGTRSLAQFGVATATKLASGIWIVSGTNLS